MVRFLVRRILYGLLVLVMVVLVITSIIYLAPVDPARLTFGQRADLSTIEAKRKELGLDQTLPVQLAMYLRDLSPINWLSDADIRPEHYHYATLFSISGKYLVIKTPYLRESFQTGRKVSDMMADAIPQTAILAFSAMLLAALAGIFLGVLTSLYPHTWLDHAGIIGSVLGYSLPSYIVAMLLALVFGYWLGDVSGLNIQGSLFELNDAGDEVVSWKNLILPALALGIRPVALIMQLTRSTMLDILSQDYIRTARAKGASKWRIVVKHALRNALNPVTTAVSGWLAGLLAGTFFVENVFGYNGLGQMTVNALLNFDIPVVLGAVLFTAAIFVLMNILVDILYTVLDPRVRIN